MRAPQFRPNPAPPRSTTASTQPPLLYTTPPPPPSYTNPSPSANAQSQLFPPLPHYMHLRITTHSDRTTPTPAPLCKHPPSLPNLRIRTEVGCTEEARVLVSTPAVRAQALCTLIPVRVRPFQGRQSGEVVGCMGESQGRFTPYCLRRIWQRI